LIWCKAIKLKGDPYMLDKPVQAIHYLVACFVISLTKGKTIQGRTIQHVTMRNYVKAIPNLYTDWNADSPYYADVDYITLVFRAVCKYKSTRHRRDMIHGKIAHLMEATQMSWSKDFLEMVLTDWVYLGRFVGFCSIEWCLKSSTRITTVNALMDHLWTLSAIYAFILEDFGFFTEDKHKLVFLLDIDLSQVAYVTIRF
jgi:hypothetical protein